MLQDELKKILKGDVSVDDETLEKFSKDASLFIIKPQVVVAPKGVDDIKALVSFVTTRRGEYQNLSLTARSGGTDMTGGSINESIVLDFSKYFTTFSVSDYGTATTEPGVYYRDFEKETLKKEYIFPSYPASKNICAMGGIVNNNAGGEKSLIYGKTEKYVKEVKVVLSDGNEYTFAKISRNELDKKMSQGNFEGGVYRSVFKLLDANYQIAKQAKPSVSKNSIGYNIWDVWDREKQSFDMVKLFVGSQGTLGITTEAKIDLVKTKPYSGLLIMFLSNLEDLDEVVNIALPFRPSSVESFDDKTLKLSLKFIPGFLKLLGAKNMFSLFARFIPDFWLILTGGMPKIVLLIEFEGNSQSTINKNIEILRGKLSGFKGKIKVSKNKKESDKYWAIRHETFNLLRHKVLGKQTAPFVDDIVVQPRFLSKFLPELYAILDKYKLLYTISGHVGDGNFHIIPLMDLSDEKERNKIPDAMREVFSLVLRYGGSISGEHNDGLVRGPFIEDMFGREVFSIFKQIKNIFDPLNIFNPHKKTDANWNYTFQHIKTTNEK